MSLHRGRHHTHTLEELADEVLDIEAFAAEEPFVAALFARVRLTQSRDGADARERPAIEIETLARVVDALPQSAPTTDYRGHREPWPDTLETIDAYIWARRAREAGSVHDGTIVDSGTLLRREAMGHRRMGVFFACVAAASLAVHFGGRAVESDSIQMLGVIFLSLFVVFAVAALAQSVMLTRRATAQQIRTLRLPTRIRAAPSVPELRLSQDDQASVLRVVGARHPALALEVLVADEHAPDEEQPSPRSAVDWRDQNTPRPTSRNERD